MFNHYSLIPWGSFRGSTRRKMGIISWLGSFRGQFFGDHFRVGDHFGVGIISGAVQIKCYGCQTTYIGETGRNRNARITEHKQATKDGDLNNNFAEHHSQTKHSIDWDSSKCSTYCTNYYYYQRHTLESWNTNLEQTTLNRFRRNCDVQ